MTHALLADARSPMLTTSWTLDTAAPRERRCCFGPLDLVSVVKGGTYVRNSVGMLGSLLEKGILSRGIIWVWFEVGSLRIRGAIETCDLGLPIRMYSIFRAFVIP